MAAAVVKGFSSDVELKGACHLQTWHISPVFKIPGPRWSEPNQGLEIYTGPHSPEASEFRIGPVNSRQDKSDGLVFCFVFNSTSLSYKNDAQC